MFTQSELGAVVTTEHESHKFLSSCSSDGAGVGDVRQIKPTNTIAKHSVCREDLLRLPTARTHGECVKCAFPGPQPLTESEQLPRLSEEAEVRTTGTEYGCLVGHLLFEVTGQAIWSLRRLDSHTVQGPSISSVRPVDGHIDVFALREPCLTVYPDIHSPATWDWSSEEAPSERGQPHHTRGEGNNLVRPRGMMKHGKLEEDQPVSVWAWQRVGLSFPNYTIKD